MCDQEGGSTYVRQLTPITDLTRAVWASCPLYGPYLNTTHQIKIKRCKLCHDFIYTFNCSFLFFNNFTMLRL